MSQENVEIVQQMVNAEAVEGSGMGIARPLPSRHPSLRIAVERDRFRGMASRVKTPAKRQGRT